MRLDPEHVRKLSCAIEVKEDGNAEVKFDVVYMTQSMDRLTMWERGLLMKAIMRAVRAKRRTPEQRALLALFVHQEESHA